MPPSPQPYPLDSTRRSNSPRVVSGTVALGQEGDIPPPTSIFALGTPQSHRVLFLTDACQS